MKIIGICGSSGSGKSTACGFIREKGYPVVDCDRLYEEIITPPSACLDEIERLFSSACILPDGRLNRRELGAIVFSDSEKLKKLNSVTFSFITRRIEELMKESERKGEKAFFIDAPLLFESGLHQICDSVIALIAPKKTKLNRLFKRDGVGEDQLEKRLSNQLSDDFLRENCDVVIENVSTVENLKEKVQACLERLGL